jgi:high potential iron-sulfur protein
MTGLTRRHLLLRAVPLGIAGIAFSRAARAAPACVQPESESLRASLNYTSTGADAAATCAHCAFFTADPAGGGCGACTILGGAVDAAGHCDSFSPPA